MQRQQRLARARGVGEDVDVQSIISQVMHEGTLSERSLGIIKFAFDSIDTDGSGKLSQEEFEFAFKKVMVLLCREQRIEMFVKVDLDCSGTIEFDEFLSFFVEPVDMWSGDLNLGPQNDLIARRCAFEDFPSIASKAGVPPPNNGHAVAFFMYGIPQSTKNRARTCKTTLTPGLFRFFAFSFRVVCGIQVHAHAIL